MSGDPPRRIAKHTLLVMSGKGGVGKSSTAVCIALCLLARGCRVGVLDVDLCGPSIPRMLGLEGQGVHQSTAGWVPVFADADQKLSVMDKTAPVVWRGPKKASIIGQFIRDVAWHDDLDWLVVDTPPGTSDEHLAVTQELKQYAPDGVVLVTTPQNVSLGDVRREITFCRKAELPILGVFENMSGFVCPHCAECTNIFSSGGGSALAASTHIPFLGTIPIDPAICEALDRGSANSAAWPLLKSPSLEAIRVFVASLPV